MRIILQFLNSRKMIQVVFFVYISLGLIKIFLSELSISQIFNYIGQDALKIILSFLGIYLTSHLLRIIRLYTLLLEEKVKAKQLVQVYLITTWANFLLPYKLGEIFRITEIGNLCKNLRRGVVTVWIERFFDAIILSSFILCYVVFSNSSFSKYATIEIVLVLFVGFSLLYYLEYTYSFKYLNQFFMTKSNTYRGVYLLKLVHNLKVIHSDIKRLVRGRASLLLFFSITIWFMEVLSIYFLSKLVNINSLGHSFVILLNESLIPTVISSTELITLYRNIALVTLTILAAPFILRAIKERVILMFQKEKKVVHNQYKYKETMSDLDELENAI